MSSPTPSNISQHDVKMLKEQCCEMQWQHKKKQQLLLHLQEAAEAHCVKYMAQKARREIEAKAKKEAEKQRLVEEKKKKKQLEYLQQLWDEVLAEDTALLEGTEGSQITGSKHQKVTSKDKEE